MIVLRIRPPRRRTRSWNHRLSAEVGWFCSHSQASSTIVVLSRVGQKAGIRVRLLDTPTAGSRQLIELPLRFLQIGGVEAFGKPAMDGCQQLARFGPPALLAPQPSEARHSAQFIG